MSRAHPLLFLKPVYGKLRQCPRPAKVQSARCPCRDASFLTRCHKCKDFSDIPAFFSFMVISVQSTFMRSRRAIHRSACSCGGIASHLFSMLARVGLEMA